TERTYIYEFLTTLPQPTLRARLTPKAPPALPLLYNAGVSGKEPRMNIPLTPVRCLYRAVDLYSSKEALISSDCRFTYAQFGARCETLATALAAEGIEPGDRVAYLSFNTHKLLEGYYGVVMAQAIV